MIGRTAVRWYHFAQVNITKGGILIDCCGWTDGMMLTVVWGRRWGWWGSCGIKTEKGSERMSIFVIVCDIARIMRCVI